MYTANRIGNLYYLQSEENYAGAVNVNNINDWHSKMEHLIERDLKMMAKGNLVNGLNIN